MNYRKESLSTKAKWTKYLPLILMAAFAAVFLLAARDVEAADILQWSPSNPFLAALFLIALYAAKSMSVFFPLVVLYLAGGLLFPLPVSLAVNLAGMAACVSVPYLVGRFSAAESVDRLREKYPKLEKLERVQQDNHFLFVLIARALGVLPGDVVSLYFGSMRLPFLPYLAGSLVGLAPTMVAVSIMGDNAANPLSPGCLIAVAVDGCLVAASFLACRRMLRKNARQENALSLIHI